MTEQIKAKEMIKYTFGFNCTCSKIKTTKLLRLTVFIENQKCYWRTLKAAVMAALQHDFGVSHLFLVNFVYN